MFSINERSEGDVTVLDLSGKITIGAGSVQLREKVRVLLTADKKKLLLNLGDVSYVDSSGIGEMFASMHFAEKEGGRIVFIGVTRKIRDLLEQGKLWEYFPYYETLEAAFASFSEPPS